MPSSDGILSSVTAGAEDGVFQLPMSQRWWNMNIPEARWTAECPEYLIGQSPKNVTVMSTRDEDFHELTWPESKALIEINRIDMFQRKPSELRRYIKYMFDLKQRYGSVLSFVQHERLHWQSLEPSSSVPFTNTDDFKVLYNDWPYGIDRDITHLVVWTKFVLEDDLKTGFLTEKSQNLIEAYVSKTFCSDGRLQRENVIWFKNWRSLKSIHALEHFHVMIYRADPGFLKMVTSDDTPMSELLGD